MNVHHTFVLFSILWLPQTRQKGNSMPHSVSTTTTSVSNKNSPTATSSLFQQNYLLYRQAEFCCKHHTATITSTIWWWTTLATSFLVTVCTDYECKYDNQFLSDYCNCSSYLAVVGTKKNLPPLPLLSKRIRLIYVTYGIKLIIFTTSTGRLHHSQK